MVYGGLQVARFPQCSTLFWKERNVNNPVSILAGSILSLLISDGT
jgi:hypothetical protein